MNEETPNNRKTPLTIREQEIINLLLEGNSPKEIAYKLKITYRTVVFHQSNLYRKLEIKNIKELFNKYGKSVSSQAQTPPEKPKQNIVTLLLSAGIFLLAVSLTLIIIFVIKPYISSINQEIISKSNALKGVIYTSPVYEKINLRATRWIGLYGFGEDYGTSKSIKLADFYTGDIRNFLKPNQQYSQLRLSGEVDIELKNMEIIVNYVTRDNKWLHVGGSDHVFVPIGPGRFSEIIKIFYNDHNDWLSDELPPGEFIIGINEVIYRYNSIYSPHNFDFGRIPEQIPDGRTMAVITNLKIEIIP